MHVAAAVRYAGVALGANLPAASPASAMMSQANVSADEKQKPQAHESRGLRSGSTATAVFRRWTCYATARPSARLIRYWIGSEISSDPGAIALTTVVGISYAG